MSLLLLFLFSMTLGHPAIAQEESGVQWQAGAGTVTMDGEQMYRISLRPDIPLGKFGVGLDLELFVDSEGNLSQEGWRFDTGDAAFESIQRKIMYIRYGRPREPVYVRVGALDEVTLGYGLIMSRYRNTLDYPGRKRVGLVFDLPSLISNRLHVEGMFGNLGDLTRGGALIGFRVGCRPTGRLEFGASFVMDTDQFSGLVDEDDDGYPDAVDDFPNDERRWVDSDGDRAADDEDIDDDNDGLLDVDPGSGLADSTVAALEGLIPLDRSVTRKTPFNAKEADPDRFGMFGFDVGYPLIERNSLRVVLYAQYAGILDDSDEDDGAQGLGIAGPGLMLSRGSFLGKIEYRHFTEQFQPEYFNALYDLDRVRIDLADGTVRTKDASLRNAGTRNGMYAEAGANIQDVVHFMLGYQCMTGPRGTDHRVQGDISLLDPLLSRIPQLDQAAGYYEKTYVDTDEAGFFEPTPDTLFGYRIGMALGEGVTLLWDTRYTYFLDERGKVEKRKTVNIETLMTF